MAQFKIEEFAMRNPRAEQKLKSIIASSVPYELKRAGLDIVVTKNVYPTSELSELLVDTMNDPAIGIRRGMNVLDYGTGTGFLALQAAMRGAHVVALDINPDAVACGELNARKFGVKNQIEFRIGRNLEPIGTTEKFDRVYAGMPWDDCEAADALARSVYDPGFMMRRALFDTASRLLTPSGKIIISSYEGHDTQYPQVYPKDRFIFEVVRQRNIKGLLHFAVLVTPSP